MGVLAIYESGCIDEECGNGMIQIKKQTDKQPFIIISSVKEAVVGPMTWRRGGLAEGMMKGWERRQMPKSDTPERSKY